MDGKRAAVLWAVLAAVCYGVSAPAGKLLLQSVPPVLMAALLYLGAGLGMGAAGLARGAKMREAKITRKELPYVAAMVALDIAAPIFLMLGLSSTTPATVSLLNNFEIVATALVAMAVFKEAVGRRMWVAIGLITAASILLSVEDAGALAFSPGAVFVLLACVCWGVENNCTKMLSIKDPLQIVVVKGFGSGLGSLAIAAASSQLRAPLVPVLLALALGFVSYGLSIYFYIRAQRHLGAARTGAYYAVAPFVGTALSFALFRQAFPPPFWVALAVMALGSYFAVSERHSHRHVHAALTHEHRHSHDDGHHTHTHTPPVAGEHSHAHTHAPLIHAHAHTPDTHHTHTH